MTHHSRICKVVLDVAAADHDREVEFWAGATGAPAATVDGSPEYTSISLNSPRLWLWIQRLETAPAGPRVHIDIHSDDVDAEVARLEALGATRVEQVHSWWIMRDPAGLLFCVIPHPAGNLDDTNATRWD